MTREEMVAKAWRPYMIVNYQHPRMEEPAECLLVGINFDDEVVTLQPIEYGEYEPVNFQTAISMVHIPRRKTKLRAL